MTTTPKLYLRDRKAATHIGLRLDATSVVALADLTKIYGIILDGRVPSQTLLFRRFLEIVNDHVGETIVKLPPDQRQAAIQAERAAVLKFVRG